MCGEGEGTQEMQLYACNFQLSKHVTFSFMCITFSLLHVTFSFVHATFSFVHVTFSFVCVTFSSVPVTHLGQLSTQTQSHGLQRPCVSSSAITNSSVSKVTLHPAQ